MKSEPPDPQDSSVNQTPHPPGHVSALINPRPTVDQIHLDPQDKLTPTPPPQTGLVRKTPNPWDVLSTKHPPPTGQTSVYGPPTPEHNFWSSPNVYWIGCAVWMVMMHGAWQQSPHYP